MSTELIQQFSKKNLIISLFVITLSSLFLKLYTIDFTIPLHSDSLTYIIDAIFYSQGDFFLNVKSNPGWRLFISPFVLLIDSNNYIDYSNLLRILTLSISTITILPMYYLAKKFFSEKYSLIASALFAFEPHLNYNSGLGLSESLFILVLIISFLFILQKNFKYAYLSFATAGFFWRMRYGGIALFFALSIIYFIIFRNSKQKIPKYLICIFIFSIILIPNFIQREQQFDDPFYFWYEENLFTEDYATLLSQPEQGTAGEFIEEYGSLAFFNDFILTGLYNIFSILPRILFPYLIILVPFGILFSFRAFDQKPQFIKSNWVMLVVTIGVLIIPLSIITERRFLFQLYPILIIFATIPIQRVTEYGLSTFSFSQKKKNIFLILIVIIIFILSCSFTVFMFGQVDTISENEENRYTRFLQENINGKILDGGNALEYISYVNEINSEGKIDLKNLIKHDQKNPYDELYDQDSISRLRINGNNITELLANGQLAGLTHIAINGEGPFFFHFLKDVYLNEEKYSYLIKVFDSSQEGYTKIKMKVFEIDYKKIDSVN